MELVSRLDRIQEEARKLKFGRALLTVAFTPFYVLGWLAGSGWQIVAYVVAAIKVGWREANAR